MLGSHSDRSHSCSKPTGRFSSCLLLSREDRPKQGSIESCLWVLGSCDALWGVFPWGHYVRNQWVTPSVTKSMTKNTFTDNSFPPGLLDLGGMGPWAGSHLLSWAHLEPTLLRLLGPVWHSTSSDILLLQGTFGNFWRLLFVITGKMLLASTWVGTRDTAKHSTSLKTDSYNKERSGPNCQ